MYKNTTEEKKEKNQGIIDRRRQQLDPSFQTRPVPLAGWKNTTLMRKPYDSNSRRPIGFPSPPPTTEFLRNSQTPIGG